MEDINQLTGRIIGVAVDVHRALGRGLSEIAYERAFCMELAAAGLSFARQIAVPVTYRGEVIAEYRRRVVLQRSQKTL